MTVLESQHAAEVLSVSDLSIIGLGMALAIGVFSLANDWRKRRASKQRRMDDRAFEAWQRDMDARAQRPEHMSWADALDFPWPSEAERRERRDPSLRLVTRDRGAA